MSSSHRLPSHQQKQSVPDFRLHSLNQQKGTPEKKGKGTKRKELENKNTDTSTIVNDTNICAHPPSLHKHRRREEKRLQKKSLAFHRQKRSNQQKKKRCIRYVSFVIIRVCQRGPVNYHHIDTNAIRRLEMQVTNLLADAFFACLLHTSRPSKRKDKDKKEETKQRERETANTLNRKKNGRCTNAKQHPRWRTTPLQPHLLLIQKN